MTVATRAPAIALSHGGGPMPVLGDPNSAAISASLRKRVPEILGLNGPNRPRAIIMCTAHWSEERPTISSGSKHKLYYDYYGFPPESYKLKYDAPGSPEVAAELAKAIEEEGLKPVLDGERGWDHGVFIPMLLVHPAADIPIVQMSVLNSEDPTQHYALGRALAKLREKNVAVIGSGFASLHNIPIMLSGSLSTPDFRARSDVWSNAVTAAATESDSLERESAFRAWRQWPHAYEMHPRGGAEHFLPLVVAAGAGGQEKAKYYTDKYRGVDMYSYYWD